MGRKSGGVLHNACATGEWRIYKVKVQGFVASGEDRQVMCKPGKSLLIDGVKRRAGDTM